MADFPPNPEDGELWLPSDVFLEIVSTTNVKVQTNKKNLVPHPTLNSFANVAPEIQGFKNRQAIFVYGKSEGTGVFLPRFKKSSLKEEYCRVLARGTGVFLSHQVMDRNKNNSEKNAQGYEKKQFGKEESDEK